MDAKKVPVNNYSAEYLRGAIDMAFIFEQYFNCNGGMPCAALKGQLKKDFQQLFFDFIKDKRNLAMVLSYADCCGFNFALGYGHDKKGKSRLSRIEYKPNDEAFKRSDFERVLDNGKLFGESL